MRRVIIIFLLILCNETISAQVNLDSSNLPIVIIDTDNQTILDEPKIPASMKIIFNGQGIINHITDSATNYDGHIGIELRGSSSRYLFDKKSFGIETWDGNGEDIDASLIGLPEEEDWVLYGPYSDKTLLRNALAMKLGRDLGRYASRTRFCEIILDNNYWGVYVLMEKVKRDSVRVDIAKLNPDEVSGDDLTGGYMIKLDKFDGGNSGEGWASQYKPPGAIRNDQVIYFQFDYPKGDEIAEEQRDFIKQRVTVFENALYEGNSAIYKSYMDYNSFIDYAIINEISRNVDAYRLSTFIYKDKDSKGGEFTLGPIWDFNLAFGNADYCSGSNTTGWAWNFNEVCDSDNWLIPFWWDKLLERNSFWVDLKNRWFELREGAYAEDRIISFIDSTATVIEDARIRNFQRWPVIGFYVWPNNFVGNDYDSEISYLKEWISSRLEWMDHQFTLITAIDDNLFPTDQISIYPNPSRNTSKINLQIDKSSYAAISIFDSSGRKIRNLWEGHISDSQIELNWDGNDDNQKRVSSGLYILRAEFRDRPGLTVKIIRY